MYLFAADGVLITEVFLSSQLECFLKEEKNFCDIYRIKEGLK